MHLENHRGDKREGYDNGCRYSKRVRLFLLGVRAVRVVSKFVFQDFVVVRRFEVGKFRALFPAGIGVAPAVRAEGRVIFNFGMAMGTEHG